MNSAEKKVQLATDEITIASIINTRHVKVFMATDIIYMLGGRSPDSRHESYRRVLRVLNKLHRQGRLNKYYIHEANVSVFWRECDV